MRCYIWPSHLSLNCILIFPVTRLTHDISLDEFEDDDLSEITEITDERGMSLNCNGPDLKVSPDLAPLRFNEMLVQ